MQELYCVLHKDRTYSPDKAAGFLAAELCITRPEAGEAAEKNPGFLLENASLAKASAFNLRASAYGLETLLLSQLDLKYPAAPLLVSKIELQPAGFYYTAGPVKEFISFEAVRAAAAGAFSVELPPVDPPVSLNDSLTTLIDSLRARYFPSVPFPAPRAPRPQPRAPAKETLFIADLLTADRRLSLVCDEQDYSGLGPKKTLSGFENFRTLLAELSALAFKAGKNDFLDAFVSKRPVTGLKHVSRGAYEKELIWLSTLTGIKES